MADPALENLRRSSIYLGIVSENFLKDDRAAMMLGHAIFMNKTIYLIVLKGTTLPTDLKKIANFIEYVDSDADIEAAAKALAKKLSDT